MVTDLILVCMVCECNVCVIPRSVSRKDLGYQCRKQMAKIWKPVHPLTHGLIETFLAAEQS
jgi:hypothetical protein